MPNNDDEKKDFDECFWAFVYLVISDNRYLSDEGRMIKEIVECGGYCGSISEMARKLQMQKPKAHTICKNLEEKGYITMIKHKNSCIIKFNENIITSALRVPHKILEGRQNGN